MLDTGLELQSLKKTLKEARRCLTFRAEVATVRNFRLLVGDEGGGGAADSARARPGLCLL
jgi:hypothetical protein